MPLNQEIKKVLIIGSGPIVIGQAAEFDYSGTQACQAIGEEGIETVLVNSNPATIMTDEETANVTYIEPLTLETLIQIIEKEKPDGVLAGFGGQTALNLAMALEEGGHLKALGSRLLGMKATSIYQAEDRDAFRKLMKDIGEPIPESVIARDYDSCEAFMREVGLPLIIRPAYTLGGTGGGIATDIKTFERLCESGLVNSPIGQILIERSIAGWKEIEYEVMRDGFGNAMIVCNMENFDPVGVHTGDSIVVAPSQTLPDETHQMLRDASLKIIHALGIEGGCNVQFGLHPNHKDYIVIEVNPRVSRSSALASKAAGYPIAKIAAKIALGYGLHELKNYVTKSTSAFFEPALDYVVVKFPKFPFEKFKSASRQLTTQMKATGEVMAIDRSFGDALEKAVASLDLDTEGLTLKKLGEYEFEAIERGIGTCDENRFFMIYEGLKRGMPVSKIAHITGVDPWFLEQMKSFKPLKQEGRVFKMVDTCSAEFEAQTPYYYSCKGLESDTWQETETRGKKKVVVIGSGPIRIGQGVEFDYACVHAVKALKKLGFEAIMINNNPETVSTDFDIADQLYFEPLTFEYVRTVLEKEKPHGVMVQFGGQTSIKLAKALEEAGYKVLGSAYDAIDLTEDRERFRKFLTDSAIACPLGEEVSSKEAALEAAERIGYPVVIRPSYVIGGQAMQILYGESCLEDYYGRLGEDQAVFLMDEYIKGTEIEVDAISDGTDIFIPGIMEHIEKTGVHSGDSITVYPTRTLGKAAIEEIVSTSRAIARGIGAKGLLNIQYVWAGDKLYVIEVNPRASRTVPILSKITQTPMVEMAVRVSMGESLSKLPYGVGLKEVKGHHAVKIPVFSTEKLGDADMFLSPEMKSTGEVLGMDWVYEKAVFKAFLGAGYKMATSGNLLMSLRDEDKDFSAVEIARGFIKKGFHIYATEETEKFLKSYYVPCERLDEGRIWDKLMAGDLQIVINTPTKGMDKKRFGYALRNKMITLKNPLFTSLETSHLYLEALEYHTKRSLIEPFSLQSYGGLIL